MKRLLVLQFLIVLYFARALFAADTAQTGAETTDLRQAFISGNLVVKGEGAAQGAADLTEAQKSILSLRAAKIVALRDAVEMINGVRVRGETTVANAASQSDTIHAAVRGIIKGAQVIKENYDPVSGLAVVFVSIPLSGPNGLTGQLVTRMGSMLPKSPEYRPENGAVQAGGYDGLIVDCRDVPFKPALINRILAKDGEVIYDPSRLPKNVLVEKGAAGYTDGIEKARTLLVAMGSKNPLVVKAAGVVESTDAEVSPDDARIIFGSNQDNNYLQAAKVIFVLR